VKLLLVDGHYYAYRSFHAIRNLTNSRGEPTGAIYGFTKTLRRMVKDLQPDFAAVIWDMGLPERRTKLQPEYKQQRAEMPADMVPQLDYIQTLVPQIGFPSLGLPNTEADDLMASYATAAVANGIEVVLATNDKDLFQLVDHTVHVYSTNKTDLPSLHDTFALLGSDHVVKKWGIPPAQIGEVLCLIGDTSDNIPGISGLGPKNAAALLREHGSLDAILANPDRIKSERIREKIKSSIAQIHQNREMVRLDLDLPLPVAIKELKIRPDYPALIASLEHCGFRSLLAEVKAEAGDTAFTSAPPQPAPAAAPAKSAPAKKPAKQGPPAKSAPSQIQTELF